MERRAFQGIIAILSLIPLIGLFIGFGPGAAFFFDAGAEVPVNLDNQFRYLCGVYISVTLAIWWSLPKVETRVAPLRIVCVGVMLGAVGRVLSMVAYGAPSDPAMVYGVGLEAGVVPLLLLWHARLIRLGRDRALAPAA